MAVTGFVITAGVTAYAAYTQYNAAEEQKEAMQEQAAQSRRQYAAQKRIADIKNMRERADAARKARAQRAAIVNTGAANNVQGSTGVLGGVAGVQTQAAGQAGDFQAIQGNQEDIYQSSILQSIAAEKGGNAQAEGIQAGAIASASQSLFSLGSGKGGLKTIFDAIGDQ